jgi:hypothetical protein
VAPTAYANVADAAHALVRTMERLYAERTIVIAANAQPNLIVRVPTEDL